MVRHLVKPSEERRDNENVELGVLRRARTSGFGSLESGRLRVELVEWIRVVHRTWRRLVQHVGQRGLLSLRLQRRMI